MATTAVLLPIAPVSAQLSNDVVISEIFYNPNGQAEGHEFLELHNTTAADINVSGWKFLTGIDFTFPAGSSIAANSYVVIAQDSADFQAVFGFIPTGEFGGELANGGENLTLVTPLNAVIDQVIYDDVAPWPLTPDGSDDSLVSIDASLAPDDPARWVAGTPTPQVANNPVLDVIFSVQRGWYSSTQTVTLNPSVFGATVFYNTTGNGAATIEYTGPITVANNSDIQVIQAQASLNGQASTLNTHTYVFKPDTGAPVVATWPNGLAAAMGENELTRSFEFIPPPSTGLTPSWANAGVKASAGGVDAGESDKLFFRGDYGNSTLTGDLFGDDFYGNQPTTDIDQLFLRNNQGDATHLRQIFAHDALLEAGQLSPHGRFIQYYKSGTNEGPRHMQERPEGGFMESYTGIDKDLWLAWSTNETTPGSGTPNGLGGETMGAPFATWAEATKSINPESLVDYLLVQWQAKVSDYRNIKNFRTAGPVNFANGDGGDYRYHFFNWDLDLGYNNNQYGRGGTAGWGWAGYTSPDYLAHDLDDFVEFRLLASDRIVCAHFDGGPLTQEAFTPRLDARRQELVDAGGANEQAFVSSLTTWIGGRNVWLLDEYRSPGADQTVYGVNRPDGAPWKPPSNFNGPLLQSSDPVAVDVTNGVLSITNPNSGTVYYRTDGGDPRLGDGSLSPAAIQYAGPIGLIPGRQEIIARSFDSTETDTFQSWSPACNEPTIFDVLVTGNPGESPGAGIVVTEIQYNPDPTLVTSQQAEFIEILNTTSSPINASGFSFSQGINFTFPSGSVLAPGQYATIVPAGATAAHAAEYGGSSAFGEFTGRLDDSGETVTLIDAVGAEIDTVTYDDMAPWATDPDGNGPSLSLQDSAADNSLAASWRIARSAGTPGAPNDTGLRGDVNCDNQVNVADALITAQYSVGVRTPQNTCPLADQATSVYAPAADINTSDTVNVADALLIAQCAVNVDNGFCELP